MTTQLMQPHANPFNFDDVQVRTATDDHGEVWFCAKDVFSALEVHWSGSRGLSGMPETWQGVGYLQTPSGIQSAVFISEAGVYQTLFRSRKPKAQEFAEWVCGEVLPAIRKQGFFGTVPSGQRLAFSKQIASLSKELVKTRDQFQKQILVGELRTLYTLIGQPMPSQELIGQDPRQHGLSL